MLIYAAITGAVLKHHSCTARMHRFTGRGQRVRSAAGGLTDATAACFPGAMPAAKIAEHAAGRRPASASCPGITVLLQAPEAVSSDPRPIGITRVGRLLCFDALAATFRNCGCLSRSELSSAAVPNGGPAAARQGDLLTR
jgi:hypothetical protein